jgi:hypothetical protein
VATISESGVVGDPPNSFKLPVVRNKLARTYYTSLAMRPTGLNVQAACRLLLCKSIFERSAEARYTFRIRLKRHVSADSGYSELPAPFFSF